MNPAYDDYRTHIKGCTLGPNHDGLCNSYRAGPPAREERSKLPSSFDARDWAREFTQICASKGISIDYDWMVSWFANAIMCGYDHARTAAERELAERERKARLDGAIDEHGMPCNCKYLGPAFVPCSRRKELDRDLAALSTSAPSKPEGVGK